MNAFELRRNQRQAGQTLIIAMITLGLLLILGFVFLGIIDRNVRGAALAQTRSQANDLSEGGIRFAQGELVDSPLGADWRGALTSIPAVSGNPNDTLDPDAYYLRPAAKDSSGNPILWPNSTRQDFGGPDGLGPFIRWNAPGGNGRALIRVRYAPSDANVFSTTPNGPLRSPGQVHSYLQIESIGRPGVINVNDPTTLASGTPVQFQGFTTTSDLQQALATMQQYDTQFVNGRHLLAFATPAITDYALFITNKFNVSRAADLGNPNPTGGLAGVGDGYCPSCTTTDDPSYQDVGAMVPYMLGASDPIASPATTNALPPMGASVMCNADLNIHGNVTLNQNRFFADKLLVNGRIVGDSNAQLNVIQTSLNPPAQNDQWNPAGPNTWVPTTYTLPAASSGPGGTAFDSSDPNFSSLGGSILDGVSGQDLAGFSRGIGRLEPPSTLTLDPSSQENRYLEMTRESGIDQSTVGGTTTNTGINSGQFGHGSGVYVGNSTDIQEPTDETGRAGTDATESLVHDWLNPGNGDPTSGWQGPFYVPVGAVVTLLPDGFTIQLDNGTWKDPTGADSGLSTLRYRIGQINGQLYIVDGIEPTAANPASNVNGPATGPGAVSFTPGQLFNGVLYFAGNVRIRGTIPTDVQMTVVSGATIYIEGSIVKGAVGNDVTDGYVNTSPLFEASGTQITRISKSSLMLMAKDHVAVNTTQFTGLLPGQSVNVANDHQGVNGFNALRMVESTGDTSGSIGLTTDLLTDPDNPTNSLTYNANDPSTWLPYALEYKDGSNNQIFTKLLFTHSMDDGTGAATFIQENINYGTYTDFPDQRSSVYQFPGNGTTAQTGYFSGYDNTASDYDGTGFTPIPQYGLGKGSWQNYPKFETRGYNLIDPSSTYTSSTSSITSTNTDFHLFAPGPNEFQVRPSYISGVSSNDYLLAKAAVVPGDVRIEASVFAEEGSFFIIPGIWTSPNPNDTRAAYNAAVSSSGQQAADQQRLENYGNGPEVPFYGEPLDIRVQLIGSVSENMPPPVGVQTAWIQKWGWIPTLWGGDNNSIPTSHIPAGNTSNGVPNFVLEYDPALATGRTDGLSTTNDPTYWVRTDSNGRALLPMPRLPVSPALTYFGEVQ